jgi:hypothetical protein
MEYARPPGNDDGPPDLSLAARAQALTTRPVITTLSLWKDRTPLAQGDNRRGGAMSCARCQSAIDGRPLPRQLAALSLLRLPLCRICYLDVEESAASFGEDGRAFEDRLFAKLASLAEELEAHR